MNKNNILNKIIKNNLEDMFLSDLIGSALNPESNIYNLFNDEDREIFKKLDK